MQSRGLHFCSDLASAFLCVFEAWPSRRARTVSLPLTITFWSHFTNWGQRGAVIIFVSVTIRLGVPDLTEPRRTVLCTLDSRH